MGEKMYYDDYVRREAVRLVVEEKMSRGEVSKKFGIRGHSTISKWINNMGKDPSKTRTMKTHSTTKEKELLSTIADLKQQLKQKDIEALFYKHMVNVAEDMFDIPIKKKLGTSVSESLSMKKKGL
ncbi:MAG: hypothetical protein Kapaf2KO_18570 [Candidatus Kapaibacteriales bacterium]